MLSDEEAFTLCNQGVIGGDNNDKGQISPCFDMTRMPYQLIFENLFGDNNCNLCKMQPCKGCLVPFDEETKVED